jgi:hypothetical protein
MMVRVVVGVTLTVMMVTMVTVRVTMIVVVRMMVKTVGTCDCNLHDEVSQSFAELGGGSLRFMGLRTKKMENIRKEKRTCCFLGEQGTFPP